MRGFSGSSTVRGDRDGVPAVEALLAWWAMAGVDACVDEHPSDWLGQEDTFRSIGNASPAGAIPSPNVRPAKGLRGRASAHSQTQGWPSSLPDFEIWLETGKSMTEHVWPGPTVLPSGPAGAPLMVVLDMPEAVDGTLVRGGYLSGDADRLLDGMIRAMGFSRDAIHIAALSTRRPPGGILPDEAGHQLAARMKHHIALVAPSAVLVLGDGTSRFLGTTSDDASNPILRNINHDSGTVGAIATFHPRFMLRQPAAKGECWRALQVLMETGRR